MSVETFEDLVSFSDVMMDRHFVEICQSLEAKYGRPIGVGTGRVVFGNAFVVVKVPLNLNGDLANYREAGLYEKNPLWHYARCRIAQVRGQDLLVMERLREPENRRHLPDWAIAVDCQQVGYNRHQVLKAYDFGS